MRPEFLVPDEFTRETLRDVLELVGVTVPEAEIGHWTRFELILAYDWAWRKHLVAGDYPKRLLRDKPEFVRRAQLMKVAR
jgi:hypothetical protein